MKFYKLILFTFCTFITNAQTKLNECEKTIHSFKSSFSQKNPFHKTQNVINKIRQCAEDGNYIAENYLGLFYLKGTDGFKKDKLSAFKYIQKAAKKGYAPAQYNLGSLYKHGDGCEIDFEKSIKWFEEGSSNGNQKSAYALGYMYFKGYGVPQDYKKAIYWFKRSKHFMAVHYLGLCYYLGYGVTANEEKAIEILLQNPIINSQTLVKQIKKERKRTLFIAKQDSLLSKEKKSYHIDPKVLNNAPNELEYYPLDTITTSTLPNNLTGKLIQLDWSKKHIERISPIRIALDYDKEKEIFNVKLKIKNLEFTKKAIWKNQTLYFKTPIKNLKLEHLYDFHPNSKHTNYSILSIDIQEYIYKSETYLVGYLNTYIPSYKEYGEPMAVILKHTSTNKIINNDVSEDILYDFVNQEDQFIKLYPIPFKQDLSVNYSLDKDTFIEADIFSLDGHHHINILPKQIQKAKENYTHNIYIPSHFPEGLYVVRVTTDELVHTRLILKEN